MSKPKKKIPLWIQRELEKVQKMPVNPSTKTYKEYLLREARK